mgnify:FL=1|jgi:tripartite-type tricarboxylate transporter receptor subunit TctC
MIVRILVLLLVLCVPAYAEWPNDRPIHLIVSAGPGSGTDIIARYLAPILSEKLKQVVIIENKVGTGTLLATLYTKTSQPDGYTLLLTSSAFSSIPYSINAKFDPINDFTHLAIVATTPIVLVTPNKITDIRQLLNKKDFNYGIVGRGTPSHLSIITIIDKHGTGVFYRSATDIIPELLAERMDAFAAPLTMVKSMIEDNTLHAHLTFSTNRIPDLSTIPTSTELRFTNSTMEFWTGFLAPAGLPDDIKNKLIDVIKECLSDKEFISKLKNVGGYPFPRFGKQFRDFVLEESIRYKKLIYENHLNE